MGIITTENLTKIFKSPLKNQNITALDNLNIEIEKGEIFGLLGPNGSGKTTMIKIFLGLIFPTRGKVSVLGSSPRKVSFKKEIGYLPETPYFYEFMNPLELLDFYGKLFEIPSDKRKRDNEKLLELVGLSKFKKLKIRNFSKGMVQRVGLAASIINNPKLLILDEPTLGLDPLGVLEIQHLLKDLKKKGMTIFLSSHLLSEVQESCDRVGILYKGELIKIGSLDELLKVKNELQVTLKGDEAILAEKIKKFAKENSIDIHKLDWSRNSLRELFIATIKGRTRRDE